MKTAPTLCATACNLSLGTVGYTIGVECSEFQQGSPVSNRTQSNHTVYQTPASNSSTPTETPLSRHRIDSKPSNPEQGFIVDNSPSKTPRHARNDGLSQSQTSSTIPSLSTRSSGSQIKRLCSLRLSRSPPIQRPTSRALSQSSDPSTPFLHDKAPSQFSTPNKLIKRSLSQHMSLASSRSDLYTDKQAYQRPATSHQRLAALADWHLSGPASPSQGSPATTDAAGSISGKLYKRFFTVQGLEQNNRASVDASKTGEPNIINIRRLDAKLNSQPYLVLAESIEVSVDTKSTKSSPLHNTDLTAKQSTIAASSIAPNRSSSSNPEAFEDPGQGKGTQARRSFSIAELWSITSPNSRQKSAKNALPGKRLTLRYTRRSVSAPGWSMEAHIKPKAEGNVKRSTRRTSEASTAQKFKPDQKESDDYQITPEKNYLEVTSQRNSLNVEHQPSKSPSKRPVPTDTPSTSHSFSSAGFPQPNQRPSRYSSTPSDLTSSQYGSDHDARVFSSGDEDDGDYRSDTIYDSLRTGATRSTSGRNSTKLESLFDNLVEAESSEWSTNQSTVTSVPKTSKFEDEASNSMVEGEESLATPVHPLSPRERASNQDQSSNKRLRARFSDSPHLAAHQLKLGQLERDGLDNEHSWSDDEDDSLLDEHDGSVIEQLSPLGHRIGPDASQPRRNPQGRGPVGNQLDLDVKNSLFDWSEQPAIERNNSSTPQPRPKTVHGKKGTDARGSRGVGRMSSALHARSQSVPVTPDTEGGRSQIKNKFGTWGIASKGVPEDWNDDFSFDDTSNMDLDESTEHPTSFESASAVVVVPDSIRQQQINVIANIGLLREWGLHIEELKELRMRAVTLDILVGEHAPLFDEIDAMIDLADQEVEGDVNVMSVDSTPDAKARQVSGSHDDNKGGDSTGPRGEEAAGLQDARIGRSPESSSTNVTWTPPGPAKRPRKDSEAVAQSVIEALQQRRTPSADVASAVDTPKRKKKVPFDTATLKHIVPYVNGLMRRVKQVIRETEGLHEDPYQRSTTPDPPLKLAFVKDGEY